MLAFLTFLTFLSHFSPFYLCRYEGKAVELKPLSEAIELAIERIKSIKVEMSNKTTYDASSFSKKEDRKRFINIETTQYDAQMNKFLAFKKSVDAAIKKDARKRAKEEEEKAGGGGEVNDKDEEEEEEEDIPPPQQILGGS